MAKTIDTVGNKPKVDIPISEVILGTIVAEDFTFLTTYQRCGYSAYFLVATFYFSFISLALIAFRGYSFASSHHNLLSTGNTLFPE